MANVSVDAPAAVMSPNKSTKLLSINDFVRRALSINNYNDLVSLRQDSIETENFYREMFARKRDNWEVPEIDENYHFLLDIFSEGGIIDTGIFNCLPKYDEDIDPRCFPLEKRRPNGELGIIPSLKEFEQSWNSLTEGKSASFQFTEMRQICQVIYKNIILNKSKTAYAL